MSTAILFFLVLTLILTKVNLICTVLTFGTVSEDFLVEHYEFPVDIDHGEQHHPQNAASETSKSETSVVSLSEGIHFFDKESAEATCIDTQFPSFQGQPFHCENQISNVVYEQSAVEMFKLQAAEEALSVALHDMSDAMAFSNRQDIRPWCKVPAMDSGAKYICCALAGISARLFSMGTVMGPISQSSQDAEKEIEVQKCQREQDPAWHSRGQSAAAAGTHDAYAVHPWDLQVRCQRTCP